MRRLRFLWSSGQSERWNVEEETREKRRKGNIFFSLVLSNRSDHWRNKSHRRFLDLDRGPVGEIFSQLQDWNNYTKQHGIPTSSQGGFDCSGTKVATFSFGAGTVRARLAMKWEIRWSYASAAPVTAVCRYCKSRVLLCVGHLLRY